ncbi:MAG TPA: TCR/Tet family MFS transporter [Stellaceae bacterium]|nr:TCR/Tet family MFS transporter [Stellaceae bacterium]
MTETADPARPAAGRTAAVAFIYVTIALDMISMGIVIPVLPKLVLDFLGGDAAHTAKIVGLFSIAWATMQFIFSPLLGSLSDRFGRRPVVLISNFGLGFDYLLMALAPGIWLLFVGRVIAGITAASISTAYAYITDVTAPEKRAAAFGKMSMLFGLGFVCGPWLGGELGGISPRLPFWVAAALSLFNGCYGLLILPESLPRERRGAFSWRRANPLGSLILLSSQRELFGLAGVNLIMQVAHASLPSLFILYGLYRYGWDTTTAGRCLAMIGLSQAIVGGFLVRPIVTRLGERTSLIVGLAFGMMGFLLFGLASSTFAMFASIPVLALWGIGGPALQALMTRRVLVTEQGQLQGANSSITGVAGMIGPGIFTQVFAYFIQQEGVWYIPGSPYFLAALLMVAAVGLGWLVTRPSRMAVVHAG